MVNKDCKDCNFKVYITDGNNPYVVGQFKTETEARKYRDECAKWETKDIYKYEIKEE